MYSTYCRRKKPFAHVLLLQGLLFLVLDEGLKIKVANSFTDLETQLFQRPTVCLSNVLSCCCDVRFWYEHAAKPQMKVLEKHDI